jgi:methylenetetrahydrofolate dehydrogenase (NADP+)/methenyltetrahydrofolate cyclohydrolase
MSEIIDGKRIAESIRREIASGVELLKIEKGVTPSLTVILIGNDPASEVYVKSKAKAAGKLGIQSETVRLTDTVSEKDVLNLIAEQNEKSEVHGILVQLPLPIHLNTDLILERLSPRKDVDGLHPTNLGLLAAGRPAFIPCTPFGIWELLKRTNHSPEGQEVVILGRSNLVGKPLSLLLSMKQKDCNATVTLCHSGTSRMLEITRRADILISAMGQAEFITGDMVKPGAVVIDVGIHRKENGKLVGDVDFASVAPLASAITPVPGGVGPMTIAMLMHNTFQAAKST